MPNQQTVMAFDYGDMRIGVAIGNSLLRIAHPIDTVAGDGMWNKIDKLAALVNKWQPTVLVVGLPNASANLKKMQLINTINNFAKRIGNKFNLPVVMVNEDFSSAHASSLLNEQGVYAREQKGKLDQLAACSILECYFFNYFNQVFFQASNNQHVKS